MMNPTMIQKAVTFHLFSLITYGILLILSTRNSSLKNILFHFKSIAKSANNFPYQNFL